jgi:tetratricopeptide (TPR) repeat protein
MKNLNLSTMKYSLTLLLMGLVLNVFGQIEDELGFIYVKADYMIETGRYDEAATEFSKIIMADAEYKDALLKRADCYYNMGNNKSSLEDLLESIRINGINAETVKLHAMIATAMKNASAAQNSLELALQLNYKDADLHYLLAENYKNQEDFRSACESWSNAANMGHNKARLQLNKYCRTSGKDDQISKSPMTSKDPVIGTKIKMPRNSKSTKNQNDDDKIVIMDDGVILHKDPPVEYEYQEPEPKIDDSVVNVDVDEDLSLTFKNGIGARKILKQPDILIMSESEGNVAIDICINRRGKVESAEVNEGETNIKAQSLISLAIRKAQEFWFEKNDEKEMCGTVVFNINQH